jgi:ankyrin repeat protein
MAAARNGRTEAMEVLLKAGAAIDKTDYTGRDALAWAADSRTPAAAALLRQFGAH